MDNYNDDIKRLSVNNVNIWLVKMPAYVTKCWYSAKPGDILGSLRIENGKKNSIFFSNELENLSPEMANPFEHVLEEIPVEDMNHWAYSEEKPHGKMCVEGCLLKKLKCVPVLNSYYKSMQKSNFEKAHQRRRVLCLEKVIRNKPDRVDVNLYYNPTNLSKFEYYNHFPHRDPDHVKSLITNAYSKRQFYTIWDLQKLTKQTLGQLKPIIQEMCSYIKTYPNKFMWALKEDIQEVKENEAEEKCIFELDNLEADDDFDDDDNDEVNIEFEGMNKENQDVEDYMPEKKKIKLCT